MVTRAANLPNSASFAKTTRCGCFHREKVCWPMIQRKMGRLAETTLYGEGGAELASSDFEPGLSCFAVQRQLVHHDCSLHRTGIVEQRSGR